MKTIKVISRTAIVVAIMARTLSAQAARPIDEFLFDEPAGFFATNSGSSSVIVPLEMLKNGSWHDSHGPGLANGGLDQSFADGSNAGSAQQTTLQNTFTIDDNNIDTLKSFTLMGWLKSDGVPSPGGNLFLKHDGANGFGLNAGGGGLGLLVDGGAASSAAAYTTSDQWTFFAATYDGTIVANNVKFYKGTATGNFSNAVLVSTHTLNQGTVNDSGEALVLAGRGGGNTPFYTFDGVVDVMRIFGSKTDDSGVLSLGEIQFWQTQIPEPSTVALLALGGLLILRRKM